MGKRRDLDRLGHFMMKKTALFTAQVLKTVNNINKDENLLKSKKIICLETAVESFEANIKTIAGIMKKAEEAKIFEFSEEDSINMSIKDIADVMGTETFNVESNSKTIPEELAEMLKKAGAKPEHIMTVKVDSKQGKELLDILKKVSETKKDKGE